MNAPVVYVHPTFDHFLAIHLGAPVFSEDSDEQQDIPSTDQLIARLKQNGFPFDDTEIGEEVYLLEDKERHKGKMMLAEGEPIQNAVAYLYDKMVRDHADQESKGYGPIVIKPKKSADSLIQFYDEVIRKVFVNSVSDSLFSDATMVKIAWYGQVNDYSPRDHLDAIIKQIMSLYGISRFLTSHFNTHRGEMILVDCARSASLAITLLNQLSKKATEEMIKTLGFSGFVQHFGTLCNLNQDYFPGLVDDSLNEATVDIMGQLGIGEDHADQHSLSQLGIKPTNVIDLIRHRNRIPSNGGGRNMALHQCLCIANQIVSTFFTERIGVNTNGTYALELNPCYGNFGRAMAELDKLFDDRPFYRFHRQNIEAFIRNADRYFRLHVTMQRERGGFISETEMQAYKMEVN